MQSDKFEPIIHKIIFILLLKSLVCFNQMARAEDESFIYSCCPVQNTFSGTSCDTCIPAESLSSEFGPSIHQGRWSVPKIFRQNQSKFQLGLEPRNFSGEYCTSTGFRIKGQYDTSGNEQVTINVPDFARSSPLNTDSKIFPLFGINGSMIYKNVTYNPSEYCFDRLSVEGEYTELDIAVLRKDDCKQLQKSKHSYLVDELFAALSGFSCLFTIVSVIIYITLRNYLNVSGWTELTHFLALGVYSAFSIPAFLYESDDTFCFVISAVLQFSEIMVYSSFIMIAFDAYWILRKADTFASYGEEVEESKMRFVIYLLFLLAVPIGVLTYGIVLNQESIPADQRLHDVPTYGLQSCFAPDWIVSEYLIFGIESATLLIILLSVNHIFGRLSASTDVEDAPRISLLSNMFFFTLCYWIIALLQFARPLLAIQSQQDYSPETFWIVLKSFNYVRGILAFIVFIFNRKTLKAFKRKAETNGSLKSIFTQACCNDGSITDTPEEDGTPMSPLMKSSSMKRSTVRQNHLY